MSDGENGNGQLIKPSVENQAADIIRDLHTNRTLYGWFMEHVVSYVVGRIVWRKQIHHLRVSRVASVGDEAVGLLLIENSWEAWREKYNRDCLPDGGLTEGRENNGTTPNQEGRVMRPLVDARRKAYRLSRKESPKYTKCGGGNSKNHGGWTAEGMVRYNELFAKVRESRRTKEGAQFEAWFLNDQKEKRLGRTSKDSGDAQAGRITTVVVQTEFSDDEDNMNERRELRRINYRELREEREEMEKENAIETDACDALCNLGGEMDGGTNKKRRESAGAKRQRLTAREKDVGNERSSRRRKGGRGNKDSSDEE